MYLRYTFDIMHDVIIIPKNGIVLLSFDSIISHIFPPPFSGWGRRFFCLGWFLLMPDLILKSIDRLRGLKSRYIRRFPFPYRLVEYEVFLNAVVSLLRQYKSTLLDAY